MPESPDSNQLFDYIFVVNGIAQRYYHKELTMKILLLEKSDEYIINQHEHEHLIYYHNSATLNALSNMDFESTSQSQNMQNNSSHSSLSNTMLELPTNYKYCFAEFACFLTKQKI